MMSLLYPVWAQSTGVDVCVVAVCVLLFLAMSGRRQYLRLPAGGLALAATAWLFLRIGVLWGLGWLGMPRRIVHPVKSPSGTHAVTVRELEGNGLAGSVVAAWTPDGPDIRLFRGDPGGVTSSDVEWTSEDDLTIRYRGRMAANPGCLSTTQIRVQCIEAEGAEHSADRH